MLVGGVSAAGKTTFATKIKDGLGSDKVSIIQMDSYYLPRGELSKEEFSKMNADHPKLINWSLLMDTSTIF